jgi:hypothetical protein
MCCTAGSTLAQVVYDVLLALLTLAAAITYSVYMAGLAAQFQARASYDVYDGSVLSRARWLLPIRASYSSLSTEAQQALQSNLQVWPGVLAVQQRTTYAQTTHC